MSPSSDVAIQIRKERREHAEEGGMRHGCDCIDGWYDGNVEGERTLANSFASWPPWLIADYMSRVTGELCFNAHVPVVARSRNRSPLLAS
jgi:hypothetical protein